MPSVTSQVVSLNAAIVVCINSMTNVRVGYAIAYNSRRPAKLMPKSMNAITAVRIGCTVDYSAVDLTVRKP